jgi:hypothetical protein
VKLLTESEKALAQRLAETLTTLGGNGLQASKRFGIPEPCLWAWRRGRRSPTRANLEKMQRCFDEGGEK